MEVKQLSTNLLNMGFMQRKEEARKRKAEAAEREKEMQDAQWKLPSSSASSATNFTIVDEPVVSTFVAGRRSFGAFNQTIEKLVKEAQCPAVAEEDESLVVSDESMARRFKPVYTGLVGKGRPNQPKSNSRDESTRSADGGRSKKRPKVASDQQLAPKKQQTVVSQTKKFLKPSSDDGF